MKTSKARLLALITVICLTGIFTFGSETGVNLSESMKKQILWDFRDKSNFAYPKISNAETRVVVKYLFGREDKTNIQITSRVSGSFTKRNVKETLYFLSGCDDEAGKFTTDCPHVSWNSVGWIVIYNGTTPVLKIKEALGGGIIKVTDVNQDGINEILNTSGYAGMGQITESVTLGVIAGNSYKQIESFMGYADNCESSFGGNSSSAASSISYFPTSGGKMPRFTVEYFMHNCGDKTPWVKVTQKRFTTFFNSLS